MSKSRLFLIALMIVFAPIGLGFWINYIIHSKNWVEFCLVTLVVISTFLWVESSYETFELHKKLKDYERKLLKDNSEEKP